MKAFLKIYFMEERKMSTKFRGQLMHSTFLYYK
uniref:Uncharacterized protein n=1 Tax=Rhizophora mucronata TaxID=61149 RepID=A0A2P2QIM2_RHIMU